VNTSDFRKLETEIRKLREAIEALHERVSPAVLSPVVEQPPISADLSELLDEPSPPPVRISKASVKPPLPKDTTPRR
jgi:hypothetical protein